MEIAFPFAVSVADFTTGIQRHDIKVKVLCGSDNGWRVSRSDKIAFVPRLHVVCCPALHRGSVSELRDWCSVGEINGTLVRLMRACLSTGRRLKAQRIHSPLYNNLIQMWRALRRGSPRSSSLTDSKHSFHSAAGIREGGAETQKWLDWQFDYCQLNEYFHIKLPPMYSVYCPMSIEY